MMFKQNYDGTILNAKRLRAEDTITPFDKIQEFKPYYVYEPYYTHLFSILPDSIVSELSQPNYIIHVAHFIYSKELRRYPYIVNIILSMMTMMIEN
jgi:hypothetical protein